MATGTVDYAASYFKYKTPTPIQGAPTNKTLKRLKQELRANASSVESDLGGGDHGFLGLVLTDVDYTSVSTTPFTAPTYPTALDIPPGSDQVTALNLRETYKEERRAYFECKMLRKRSSAIFKTQSKISIWYPLSTRIPNLSRTIFPTFYNTSSTHTARYRPKR